MFSKQGVAYKLHSKCFVDCNLGAGVFKLNLLILSVEICQKQVRIPLFQWPYSSSGNIDSSLRKLFLQTAFLFMFGWVFFGGLPSHDFCRTKLPRKADHFPKRNSVPECPETSPKLMFSLVQLSHFYHRHMSTFLPANLKHAICFFHRCESAGIATLSFGDA